ncbi:DUF992 domain-containing protein [Oricola sp.]|uniref:DUF992 domain-containing protein n=1 Tax=Oricola sp. TaxID=1979950 RepID=UPI00320C0077|nr:DUF992 domain-containing protein [Oricola sp.]
MRLARTAKAATVAFAAALTCGTAFAQDNTEAQPQTAGNVEAGVLDCIVEGGRGFIFGSTKDVSCTFTPVEGPVETYFGAITKYGIDIGETEVSFMRWAVLAPTVDDMMPGALAGDYYGVSAEATAGTGVGANALVGGSDETVSLQPVSVTSQTGVNFALAVSELELRSAAQ